MCIYYTACMNAQFWLVNERSVITEQQTAPLNNRPLSNQSSQSASCASLHSMRNMDFMPFPTWQPCNKHTMSITTKRWSQECLCKNLKREIEDVARKTVSIFVQPLRHKLQAAALRLVGLAGLEGGGRSDRCCNVVQSLLLENICIDSDRVNNI